jgi:hypothetical protein
VPLARRAVFVTVALLMGAYYLWCVRASGQKFQWGYDLGGYYNYLTRGFAQGHLYVALDPSRKLLELKNPYAADVDDSLKMHDMAFYRGRYYLYHGAAPAVLLLLPWRLLTGHDMPEAFAMTVFCFAGFLFSAATLLLLVGRTPRSARVPLDPLSAHITPSPRPGAPAAEEGFRPTTLAVLLLALGICQGVPFLLSRIWVYEMAIGCGYFCTSAAFDFFVRALDSVRATAWLAASGLMFGFSIASRPHLGLAAAFATAALAYRYIRKRQFRLLPAFVLPLTAAGLAIATYNFQRFGNPFEFGVRYLLGNPTLSRTELAARWVIPGIYYFLICTPDIGPVFPWVRLAFRYPIHTAGYFLEPTAGCLYVAPFLVGIFCLRRTGAARMPLLVMLASSAAILLFIAGTGFTTQRYEVDFLPLAVLPAITGFALAIARTAGWQRRLRYAALLILVTAGAVTSLALAIGGPYDEFLKNNPQSYTRLSQRVSPIAKYGPALNPPIDIAFTATCTPHDDGFREPLLAMGQRTFREIVALEHHPGKFRVIAQSESSSAAQEIDNPGSRPLAFRIAYHPEARQLTVKIDGREVLTHKLESLFTAPAQVTVGKNTIDPDVSAPFFTGRLEHGVQ